MTAGETPATEAPADLLRRAAAEVRSRGDGTGWDYMPRKLAEPLAAWLESEAEHADFCDALAERRDLTRPVEDPALDLARVLLGEDPL